MPERTPDTTQTNTAASSQEARTGWHRWSPAGTRKPRPTTWTTRRMSRRCAARPRSGDSRLRPGRGGARYGAHA